MKKILRNVLLISALSMLLMACAEETEPTTTTGKTAQEVLNEFMQEFAQLKGENITIPESNQVNANIKNSRADKQTAFFVGLDKHLVSLGAISTNDPRLEVREDIQGVGAGPITAGQSTEVNFTLLNPKAAIKSASICALLTQDELKKLASLIPSQQPTGAEMQAIIDLIKPYVVKINYTKN